MAKKAAANDGNKSEMIRAYFTDHKTAKSAEVIEALAKTGTTVSEPLVATIKSKMGLTKKRSGGKAGKKPAAKAAASNGSAAGLIASASEFVRQAGSVAAAIDVLKSLENFGK
ncbi:hypothetical protein [Anatilimnocola floriformis]|uniref:hypothetical protein n=1 Tax=Anatilimnocola floriformis TaxID=2948575 RepID=UPI0020C55C01|nr:hypothetical protein [Anatilimnocola floriformis]